MAFRRDGLLEQAFELRAPARVGRQEADGDPVASGSGEVEGERGAEERIGELEQDPGAVAGGRVGTLGAAMLEVRERGQRAHDRLVAACPVEPGDERDAAGVVLERGIVEAVRRQAPSSSPECELVRRGGVDGKPASPVAGARTWRQ